MTDLVDIHQHLWPEPLLGALAERSEAPCLRLREGRWRLRIQGEPEAAIDLADHDAAARADLVRADGLDRALIAPSVPLGVDALTRAEAEPLIAAYHRGVAALPDEFGAWAAVPLSDPDPSALEAWLDAGFVGACISADALAGPRSLDHVGAILELLERRGAPLFIHPGVATASTCERPSWWPAMTDYVSAMQRAWFAFATWGRPAHPELRVCFAMLAGLAPLHRERFVARGGLPSFDPNVFLDVSSYGDRAIDTVVREVGVDQIVFGSDRPVVGARGPGLGDALEAAMRRSNPARLLGAAREMVFA
ncbi:amidohydrolase family protein [Thermoleophilia bacterium SCSIO 60948]|nr:amidohydrolase family protein [Thermoleophilia bacterium SCSIO 60948]